jgi:hypothetical protein
MSLNPIASAASSGAHLVSPTAEEAHSALGHSLDAVALNPQPLPPRELAMGSLFSRFDAVSLNPQPLPPRETSLSSIVRSLDAVALNPQPLPPREALTLGARIALAADEQCGTVPRSLHHLPAPPPPPLSLLQR